MSVNLHGGLKSIRIRLEACSFSMEERDNDPFNLINRVSSKSTFQSVVGRAITRLEAEAGGLLDDIKTGDRICCFANLTTASGNLPNEIDISPYAAHSLPPEIDPRICVATLPSAIRVYTSIHTMARIRKDESILIACPNDLNLTCIAMLICRNLNLKAFALVPDETAANVLRGKTESCNFFELDATKPDAIQHACDSITGGLGFDCILDFKNNDIDNLGTSITISRLISALAAFGRLVTDRQGEPISASDVTVLHLKSSSVHFLFDQTWHLSPLFFGRYKHMLADIVDQLKNNMLRPAIALEANPQNLDDASTKHDERIGCTVIKFPNA